jgi:hypothetical protein
MTSNNGFPYFRAQVLYEWRLPTNCEFFVQLSLLSTDWLSSNLFPCLQHLGTDDVENTPPVLHVYQLLRESVYGAVP